MTTDPPPAADAPPAPIELVEPVEPWMIEDADYESAQPVEPLPDWAFAEQWAPRMIPVPWRRPLAAAWWGLTAAVGTLSLAVFMAVLAAIPLLNFYVLGALLDVEGRVARSGRVRNSFRLWGVAPRVGGCALGVWLFLLPIRLLASFASDARLIDPAGGPAKALTTATTVVAVAVAAHLLLAISRGGRFSTFFRPVKNLRDFAGRLRRGRLLRDWDEAAAGFLSWFEFRRLWWLGVRGFAAGLLWLAVPTALYVSAENPEGGEMLLVVIGFLLLTAVNCWLPVLQANLAAEERFRAGFALRTARRQFNAAPWAWLLAVFLLYLLTLPLHLFRVYLLPSDAAWLVTLVFVVTIFPTRVIVGLAAARSRRRHAEGLKAPWYSRLPAKLLLVAVVGLYTGLLFLTQFIGSHGRAVLFEQHAFLLPWPG